jgi:hypothetical protein
MDRQGPYLFLLGFQAVLTALTVLESFLKLPRETIAVFPLASGTVGGSCG